MSKACAMDRCREQSRVLCHCCKQNLCLAHLSSHTRATKSSSGSLDEQVRQLHKQIVNIDMDQLVERDRRKLDKWRDESVKKIHRYYERKCDELEQFLTEKLQRQEREVEHLQGMLSNFNHYDDGNRADIRSQLPTTISEIEQTVVSIEEHGVPVHLRSLLIDHHLISIGEMKVNEFSLGNLPSPMQTLSIPKQSGCSMVGNEQHLLIDQNPDLVLYGGDSTIVKQFPWKYGIIRDMCWSLGLASFVLITETNKAYLVNERDSHVDCIEPITNQLWTSCTCSNTLLYLVSLNQAVVEFALFPTFVHTRRWEQPDTSLKNESIKDISCSDEALALIVVSYANQSVQLVLRALTTFDVLFNIRLDVIIHPSYQLPIRCCLFRKNQWLVSEGNTSRLFHIGKDGRVKGSLKYDQQPFNAVVFRSKILAVRTENSVHFHELNCS